VLGNGGALQKIIPIFKLGIGGVIGNGNQAYSWVHIDDVMGAFLFAMEHPECNGIYNLTSPHPVTNKIFTQTLATALGRKAWLPVPKFFLKMRFGEGAIALISGQKVFPERLLAEGYNFLYADIGPAIENIVSEISESV
jgi:uncharacterized protein